MKATTQIPQNHKIDLNPQNVKPHGFSNNCNYSSCADLFSRVSHKPLYSSFLTRFQKTGEDVSDEEQLASNDYEPDEKESVHSYHPMKTAIQVTSKNIDILFSETYFETKSRNSGSIIEPNSQLLADAIVSIKQEKSNVDATKSPTESNKRVEDIIFATKILDDSKQSMSNKVNQHTECKSNPRSSKNEKTRSKSKSKPSFQCEQCGKSFKTKYTLNIHKKMPSHTTLKPFVCPTCGKGFRLSSTLCRHKIIHTSQRPHKCTVCQKSFNRSSTLKTHLRTHSTRKEFTCEICSKGFHQKGNLRNHVLIHTGEKPYVCPVCKKAFNKLSNLKFHMHCHTDQKPYRCRYCKAPFSKRGELKAHISVCGPSKQPKL